MVAISSAPVLLEEKKPLNAQKDSSRFRLHTSSSLNAKQLIKCLSIIRFISYVISTAFKFVTRIVKNKKTILLGNKELQAKTEFIDNIVKKKDPLLLANKEAQAKNPFRALLKIPLARETTSIDDIHRKIALLHIAYNCIGQLVDSYKEEKFKDFQEYCSVKVDEINQRVDIRKINKVSDEMVIVISNKERSPQNFNVILKHMFDHPPADIMIMMAEICDELTDEKGFKNQAKELREYAQLLKNEPYPNKRNTIRNSMQLA